MMKANKKERRQNKLAERLEAEKKLARDQKRRQIRLLIGGLAVVFTAFLAIKYRTTAMISGCVLALSGEALMFYDYYRYYKR